MEQEEIKYVDITPGYQFMSVKMFNGKAQITFSNTIKTDGHYNLDIRENGDWALPIDEDHATGEDSR